MDDGITKIIGPELRKRHCGGYLALALPTAGVRLATVGETEGEARDKFIELARRWLELRDAEARTQGCKLKNRSF